MSLARPECVHRQFADPPALFYSFLRNKSSETVVSDPDFVPDKDEWQHMLDTEDYNEEEAVRHAIQQSLRDYSRAPVFGQGDNSGALL